MSTECSILGIGMYNQEISKCLEYSPETYDNCDSNTTILTEIFLAETADKTRKIAKAFGVLDYTDPHFWEIKSSDIDFNQLKDLITEGDLNDIKKLLDYNFKFYLRPYF